ncbi:hypothetical protein T12_13828 [Trichinella patagoniensis]|uniref:Uncharacterized protein n=1 Tax=Trichinella patagoniensis TaxID=990121 RepID=A0A0V0ZLX6_9BILA|nr:hypothetical protein T12_13828 [Trichinella patagoniensis]
MIHQKSTLNSQSVNDFRGIKSGGFLTHALIRSSHISANSEQLQFSAESCGGSGRLVGGPGAAPFGFNIPNLDIFSLKIIHCRELSTTTRHNRSANHVIFRKFTTNSSLFNKQRMA